MEFTPLYHALLREKERGRVSFHTPGHKSNAPFLRELFSMDTTELPDTDSLYEASSVILEAEKKAAALYGAQKALFSAGGSTLCIQTMLRLAMPAGGKMIVGRTIHRSAVNAMALLNIEPIWVYPRKDAGEGVPGRVHPDDILMAYQKHPNAKAVYLTSPDYYGVLSDVEEIAEKLHPFAIPLLVDAAHGAHLRFLSCKFDPIACGASMAAYSLHKTLPALTPAAWLMIGDGRFVSASKEAMALFGSTSPSYPVMASIDLCRNWLEERGKNAFFDLTEATEQIKKTASEKGIVFPVGNCDPTRLCFTTAAIGVGGKEAAEHFRECGIEPEYCDDNNLVLIPTPFNRQEDFDRLQRAIKTLPRRDQSDVWKPKEPKVNRVLSLREAVLAPCELVCTEKSVGRIAAEAACPCPPGVPILMPGEKITKTAVSFLLNYGIFTIKVVK